MLPQRARFANQRATMENAVHKPAELRTPLKSDIHDAKDLPTRFTGEITTRFRLTQAP